MPSLPRALLRFQPRFLAALLAALLFAAMLRAEPSPAQDRAERRVTGPVLALWKDPGNPLCLSLPAGTFLCATGVPLDAPDGSRLVLHDEGARLAGALLRLSAGKEWTFLVSEEIPGLLVGVVGADGSLVRGRLAPWDGGAAR